MALKEKKHVADSLTTSFLMKNYIGYYVLHKDETRKVLLEIQQHLKREGQTFTQDQIAETFESLKKRYDDYKALEASMKFGYFDDLDNLFASRDELIPKRKLTEGSENRSR